VVALVIHGVSFAAFSDYQKWGVDIVNGVLRLEIPQLHVDERYQYDDAFIDVCAWQCHFRLKMQPCPK
jgi:hypothetical protein